MVGAMSPVAESLARRYDAVGPHLTERQRRVWLGAEARELGSAGSGSLLMRSGFRRTRCVVAGKSWMTRSRWRWAAPAFPAGAASVPGSWIRAWPTRWTSWPAPKRGRPDDAAALDL